MCQTLAALFDMLHRWTLKKYVKRTVQKMCLWLCSMHASVALSLFSA